MINYTWKIHSVIKKTIDTLDSVVISAVWEKTGVSDDGYSGSVKASVNFTANEIDENSFIKYDNLTEEVVIDWVKSIITESVVDQEIEKEIEKSSLHWMEVRDEYLPWNVVREE